MILKAFVRLMHPVAIQLKRNRFVQELETSLKPLVPPLILWNSTIVHNIDYKEFSRHKKDKILKVDEKNNVIEEKIVINYMSLLAEDCKQNKQDINILIKNLGEAIETTSEKYRKSVDQQINVILGGRGLNPLDQYWDGLVYYKQIADKFKKEFERFSNIVQFVEQLSFNLSYCTAILKDGNSSEPPCNEFYDLKMKLEKELSKIKEKELKLNKIFSSW